MTGDRNVEVWERRADLFVTWSAKTTSGIWLQQGATGPLGADITAEVLGAEVLDALGRWDGQPVAHPRRDEWRLHDPPLWAAAGVRSLRSFTGMVGVQERAGDVTVKGWVHDPNRKDAFVPGSDTIELTGPTPTHLGVAVKALLTRPRPC